MGQRRADRRPMIMLGALALLVLGACGDLAAALPPRPSPFPTLARLPSVTPVTPSPTPAPTATALPTATPRPPRLTGRVAVEANVRSGPGTDFAILAVATVGTEVGLRAQAADWYAVQLPDGLAGWMAAAVLDIAPEIAAEVPAETP